MRRQCAHWLAMTAKILPSALKIDALRNEKYVIARERSDRGNPFPGIRKDANARRAFQLHRQTIIYRSKQGTAGGNSTGGVLLSRQILNPLALLQHDRAQDAFDEIRGEGDGEQRENRHVREPA